MAYVQQFSTDPAANNKAPPHGAPEGGLSFERISDTFRVVMAACAELLENVDNVNETLGDRIAELEDNPIGSVDNATKLGGRTRQQTYDDFWPVGSERAWNSFTPAGLTPTGLSATWVLVGKDALLVGASNAAGATYSGIGGTIGSGVAAATASDGAHTHSGSVGNTSLTEFQIGSNLDAQTILEPDVGTPRRLARLVPEVEGTVPFDDATAHSHTLSVSSGGAHTHAVTLPQRYIVAWFRRTA